MRALFILTILAAYAPSALSQADRARASAGDPAQTEPRPQGSGPHGTSAFSNEIQRLLQKQDWPAAIAALQTILRTSPNDAEAHFGLALARRGAGDLTAAIAEAKAAVRLRPGYEEAMLALGLMLQQQGDVPGAITQYQQVLARNPKSAEAHNWLGVARMQKNELAAAADSFRSAIRLRPDFVRAHNNLGSTLAQSGDLDAGVQAFQAGLKYAPNDLQLRLNLGTALRNKGETDAAIQEFESVLKHNPSNHEVHHQLGLALREKNSIEASLRSFDMAVKLNPEYRDGYYALGTTLRQSAARNRGAQGQPGTTEAISAGLALGRSGDLKGAVNKLAKAVALQPTSADAQFNYGAALWYSGDAAKAAVALDESLRLDPANAPAYSLRAIIHRDRGDNDEAQRLFQRALALLPDQPHAYFDLGSLLLRRGQFSTALGQFEAGLNLPARGDLPDLRSTVMDLRTAVEKQPQADGYHVLGRMLGLAGAGAFEVAGAFSSAIRLKPDFAEAHNSLGLVYLQSGDDPKAIAAFREAIRLQPAYAAAHANLGAALTATDAVESVAKLEKAVALQPGLLSAQYNLALAYGANPKYGVAREIEQLKKVLATDANYPRASFALGRALLRKGDVPGAITALKTAVQLDPRHGEAQYQLGLALSRAGKTSEAAEPLRVGRELTATAQNEQNAALEFKEGREALARGEAEQAAVKLRQAANHKPDWAEAQILLAEALQKKGDLAGSAEAYRKALAIDPRHPAAREALAKTGPSNRVAELEALIRERRYDEARPRLETFVKEDPKSSWGWYALGYVLFVQQKVGDSISALSKSLALDITNAEAHKVLGRNLMLIGKFDYAKREFELGEKYSPKSAEMPFNLGRLYSIQDQWAQAREAFERALKLDPNYVEALDGMGFALEALGEDNAAIAHYRKAIELNEQNHGSFATPHVNLSGYYNRIGNTDSALEHARRAISVNAKADRAYFQMARAHERRGELEDARAALEAAIAINPRVSSFHYVLGTVYRRMGRQQESQQQMEIFRTLDKESNDLERRRLEGGRQ